jgi:DNA-directed RNA polymerase specialized sigma24 family protein
MSIIRREVGDTALADDLYQETFCIILEKVRRGDIREAEKLSGFVCGVARNQVMRPTSSNNCCRKRKLISSGKY